jgi:uncharacterized damage-inducible protein DinB
MHNIKMGEVFLKELEAEAPATRKCLERMKEELFDWKPHEKSMQMGYLALLIADIPRWITHMIENGEINFQTYEQRQAKTAGELLKLFDENMETARKALSEISDEGLHETFTLKNGDKVLMTMPKGESVGSTIHHWVHHRGQLTVYMRLNDIPVPAIYGSSADDKMF